MHLVLVRPLHAKLAYIQGSVGSVMIARAVRCPQLQLYISEVPMEHKPLVCSE